LPLCHPLFKFVRCVNMDTYTVSFLAFSLSIKRWLALGLATCLLSAAPSVGAASNSRVITGTVSRVTDGDTLWIKTSSSAEAIKVRLSGIDAPESCQDWGREAAAALKSKALHQTVVLRTRTRDDYGRLVASVRLKADAMGDDVGAWLVHSGHAWSYHSSRGDGPYAAEEHAARNARRGLWAAGGALEPKLFRKSHGSCKH
jgi:micrococcal nuclease